MQNAGNSKTLRAAAAGAQAVLAALIAGEGVDPFWDVPCAFYISHLHSGR